MDEKSESCFNCQRSETEIPVIAWHYKGQALWVCSECMPNLIHKWPLVAAQRRAAEESQDNTV